MLSLLGPLPVYRKKGSFYNAISTPPRHKSIWNWQYLFKTVENEAQVSFTEKDPPAQKAMRLVASDLFEAIQQRLVDQFCAKLVNQLVVIDGLCLAIFANFSGNIPRVDLLLLTGGRSGIGGHSGRHIGGRLGFSRHSGRNLWAGELVE